MPNPEKTEESAPEVPATIEVEVEPDEKPSKVWDGGSFLFLMMSMMTIMMLCAPAAVFVDVAFIWCLLFVVVVCCLLFVVCCLLFVVCCFDFGSGQKYSW